MMQTDELFPVSHRHKREKMYSILNKTDKTPNDVPFHMRDVGLGSSFHMLNALLMTISTISFRILSLTQN